MFAQKHNWRHVLSAAVAGVVSLGLLTGCEANTAQNDADALQVYATTGYIADAVINIAPEATVITMVGPGGDPHTYEPSTQDIQKMRASDLVLWNGLHLEAQMIDQLESLGDKQLAVGDTIPEDLLLPWEDNLFDPHVWNSPEAWSIAVTSIGDKLAEIDPDNKETYEANTASYLAEIEQAAATAEAELAAVENRILITGHDAFNYFGQTYNFEVLATDFVSTEAALSAIELSELADYIVEHQVETIFQDNQANPQAITALKEAVDARGWTVKISTTELFADTLGSQPPVDTYLGVFAHNASAVAQELK
ncbi:MAG: zinc ABC transporter substrate-binding protein [Arcanobacterium sp.]